MRPNEAPHSTAERDLRYASKHTRCLDVYENPINAFTMGSIVKGPDCLLRNFEIFCNYTLKLKHLIRLTAPRQYIFQTKSAMYCHKGGIFKGPKLPLAH